MEASRSKKILLVTFSVVFALLVGELALRWMSPAWYPQTQSHQTHGGFGSTPPINVYDAELGWALSPGSVRGHDSGRADVVYSIDHGERLTSLHPRSGPMIVATGCSFTFGQGVNDQDTWPWLLQEQMPNYHVVNVAAMGYGTDQALLAAERKVTALPGEVQTVVLGFGVFQIDRNRCPQSWLATTCPFGKPLFVQNGAGVQYKGQITFRSMGSLVDSVVDHSLFLSAIANLVADRLVYRIESHNGGRQLTVSLITDFARRFQARGVRLVVVILPYLSDQGPRSRADRDFVISQLRAAGVPTLALEIPRLPDGSMDPHRFTVGSHPNREYNLLLASQLAQFLSVLNVPQGSAAYLRH